MKTRIMVLAFSVILALTALPLGMTTVYAAEKDAKKTASLSDIKVSFDGNEPITIQAYNIGGEYFVRAKDITNRLNMDVAARTDVTGIKIYPYRLPANVDPLEKLTAKSINVTLVEGFIYFDGLYIKSDCFLYNDRMYLKLTDIGTAAQEALRGSTFNAKSRAAIAGALPPTETAFKSISVIWNDKTQVCEVNNQVTDLAKVYEEERKNHFPSVPSIANNPVPTSAPAPTESRVVLPELTKAPEGRITLAKILTDPNKGVVDDNFTYPYTIHPLRGQCTWYAIGRFYEVFGLDVINSDKGNYLAGGFKDWVEKAKSADCPDIDGIPYKGNGDLSNIPNRGIAIWSRHVIFIEYVERDASGYPTKIYFTEANAGHTGEVYQPGVFYPEIDGVIGSVTPENFVQQSGGTFYGFIVAK